MLLKAAIAALALGTAPFVVAQDPYPISAAGVTLDPTTRSFPPRLNINDLKSVGGQEQWDLYILSLQAMQAANYKDTLSYFQIEGMVPRHSWKAVHSVERNWRPAKYGLGRVLSPWRASLCVLAPALRTPVRGESLFSAVTEVVLMVFQQVLVSHAKRIASTYPPQSRQKYMDAAEKLRAPYWDWAADSTVPSATVDLKVQVNAPNGQRSIDNPLYTFKIPPSVVNGEYGPFDSQRRSQIVRCPSPQSYPGSANGNLASRGYKQWIFDAFSRANTFTEFAYMSNTGVSLEQIHNGIHWDAACGQQFVSPDLSAFDPLFMLHHTNVDRLWAYWQAIKPDQDIFNNSYSGQSRFATRGGTIITPRSPLLPFFAQGRVAHTTDSVRSIRSFGYSYQGLETWKSPAQMGEDARKLINRLYSSSTGSATRRSTCRGEAPQVRRYFARVHLDRVEVEKPCQLIFYLDGKQASSLVIMSQPAEGILAAGLPLDHVIQENGFLELSTNATVDAIKSTLTVKIVKLTHPHHQADGSAIDNTKVPSLQVDLEDVVVTQPVDDNKLPKFGASRLRTVLGHHLGR
ncbi:Tyrosinase [Tolypocladium paradoxum]|uniref:tyrosinase n=1 Tax=Tolypocladium paradoxum TaxID=94208 RepID=A0A2S4L8N0_9HYPO|nr:Tyrosinase [Tolypocladium paradoxum]